MVWKLTTLIETGPIGRKKTTQDYSHEHELMQLPGALSGSFFSSDVNDPQAPMVSIFYFPESEQAVFASFMIHNIAKRAGFEVIETKIDHAENALIHFPKFRNPQPDWKEVFKSIGADNLYDVMTKHLDACEAAEAAIDDMKCRYPDKARRLHVSFKLLRPTVGVTGTNMLSYHPRVYQAHIQELLNRVVNGIDTRPGTAAEIAMAFSEVSQATPMIKKANQAYALAINIVFGPEIAAHLGLEVFDPGSMWEKTESMDTYGHVQRKLAQPWRTLTKEEKKLR